jgi:hypothetical protein
MIRTITHWFGKGLIGSVLLAMPTAAFAHHPDFHIRVEIPVPVVVVPQPPCDPPTDRVWVEPVYDTVTERVWVPDVTRTEYQHVETPAQYGYRDVVFYDYFGRAHIRREQVLISPARCEDVPVQVVVCPGHFEMQTHQRLVCAGHWQDAPQPQVRLEIPLPF